MKNFAWGALAAPRVVPGVQPCERSWRWPKDVALRDQVVF